MPTESVEPPKSPAPKARQVVVLTGKQICDSLTAADLTAAVGKEVVGAHPHDASGMCEYGFRKQRLGSKIWSLGDEYVGYTPEAAFTAAVSETMKNWNWRGRKREVDVGAGNQAAVVSVGSDRYDRWAFVQAGDHLLYTQVFETLDDAEFDALVKAIAEHLAEPASAAAEPSASDAASATP